MRKAMKTKEKTKNENGFTLAEVVVSGVILTILAFGMMPTITTNKKFQIGLHERVIASAVLDREMNRLRILGAKNIPLNIANKVLVKNVDGLEGTLTYTIQAEAESPDDKYAYLDLSWTGQSGKESTVSLASFIFQE